MRRLFSYSVDFLSLIVGCIRVPVAPRDGARRNRAENQQCHDCHGPHIAFFLRRHTSTPLTLLNLDWSILHWIQDVITCPFLDFLMPKLTMLGNGGAIWLAAAGGLLCTKKYRKQGILLLAGLAAGVLVGNVVLKNLSARPRPCWLDESVRLLVASPTDYSFPSGHTLSSTIAATILAQTGRRFGYNAVPLATTIAQQHAVRKHESS